VSLKSPATHRHNVLGDGDPISDVGDRGLFAASRVDLSVMILLSLGFSY